MEPVMQSLDWLDYLILVTLALSALGLGYLVYTLKTLGDEIEWKDQDWND